jgi:hypothetical protein
MVTGKALESLAVAVKAVSLAIAAFPRAVKGIFEVPNSILEIRALVL